MRVLLLALFFSTLVHAAHPIPPLAGTFSNFNYNEQNGSIVGTEITLIPFTYNKRIAYTAIIQTADGFASAPLVAPVVYQGNGISISFTNATGMTFNLSGKITPTALTGVLSSPSFTPTEISLPRKPSYWQSPD